MKKAIVFILIVSSFKCFAQENTLKEGDVESFIEQLFPAPDDDLPYEEIYESLYQYYQHPLDLNKASREELSSLYVLSQLQINNFIKYREDQIRLISIYELQVIEGFDMYTIQRLRPFVEIRELSSFASLHKKILNGGSKYFLLRYDRTLESKKGYSSESNRYLGSADKIFGRIRISNPRDYSLGITFEKDAGETVKWNPKEKKLLFDYWSYHLYLENKGNLKKLIIGDYQLQFGQGLICGAGFSTGKSGEAVSMVRRYNTGIRPYTSSVESGFFRGIASTYSLGSVDITGYYSFKYDDASINSDTLDGDYLSAIQISGLHRTDTELSSRKQVHHHDYGTNINVELLDKALGIGITYSATHYSHPIQKRPNEYNQFDFSGDYNYNYGININYIYQNLNFFGEAAKSRSNGAGIIGGVLASLSSKTDIAIIYRKYHKSFHSFYGNAFGENAKNANEEGIYTGIRISPSRKFTVNASFDRYAKSWLSYLTDGPSQGIDYMVRVQYQPSKTTVAYLQFRNEIKEKNQRGDKGTITGLENERNVRLLINLEFRPLKSLVSKSRIQSSNISQGNFKSKGFAIIQDVTLEVRKFKISGHYCLFGTDDYSSRQYTFEKDVLYTFSFPALYGHGIRSYLLVQYNLSKALDIWIKASQTEYNDRDKISSGQEEINGNTKTDVRVQLRCKF